MKTLKKPWSWSKLSANKFIKNTKNHSIQILKKFEWSKLMKEDLLKAYIHPKRVTYMLSKYKWNLGTEEYMDFL